MELNTNMTKKDLFNAKVSSDKAESYIDKDLKVNGLAIYEDQVTRDDGTVEDANIAVISATLTDGSDVVIASPSATLVDAVVKLSDLLEDSLSDGTELHVVIKERKSNAGRKYYTLYAL